MRASSSSTAPWAPTCSCWGLSPEDFGGPELEGCNEVLINSRPDLIAQVHRSFFEVGCDVVESGTFGSSSVVLAEYGLADQAREISRTGAEIAKSVAARVRHA